MEIPNDTLPVTVLPRLQRAALVAWSIDVIAIVMKVGRRVGDAVWMSSDSPPPDAALLDLCVEDASTIGYEPEPGRPAMPGEWTSLAIWSRADDEGFRILIPSFSQIDVSTPVDFARTACRTYNGLAANSLCRTKRYHLLHRLAEVALQTLLMQWNETTQGVQKVVDDIDGNDHHDSGTIFGVVARFLEKRQVGVVKSLSDGVVTTNLTKREHGFIDSLGYAFHRAQKFVLPNLDDVAEPEEAAMNDAVLELARHNLLHLPYDEVVIADMAENASGGLNRYYIVAEHEDGINIQPILSGFIAPEVFSQGLLGVKYPLIVPSFTIKSLFDGDDLSWMVNVTGEGDIQKSEWVWREVNTAVFVVTVFLASLATGHDVVEDVPAEPRKASKPKSLRKRQRKYGCGIIRIPNAYYAAVSRQTSSSRKQMREHEVRGYLWGKNTRPLHEQRWIAPHKKGHGQAVPRNHYVVPALKKRRDES